MSLISVLRESKRRKGLSEIWRELVVVVRRGAAAMAAPSPQSVDSSTDSLRARSQ